MKKKPAKIFQLPVRYSPRINRRFLRMTDEISERNHLSESDVLRFCFEAALLAEADKDRPDVRRSAINLPLALDRMVTLRTTAWMAAKLEALWKTHPREFQADILRALLERMLPIARDKGMAHVMKIREENL